MLLRAFIIVLTVALANLAACSPAPKEKGQDGFTSDYFTVSAVGEGPNLILVPGLASSPDVWEQTVLDFQDSHTLHLVHVSGFAGAPPRGNAGNDDILEDISTDLARYSQTLQQPTYLVGHSLGGLVSLKTALRPDAQIDGLVVVDVLPFFSVLIDEAATSEKMIPMGAMMKATLLAQSNDVFESRQAQTIKTLVKSSDNQDRVLTWSIESSRDVMGQAMSEVVALDLRQEISEIRVPVSVIYASDPAIPNMPSIEAFYRDLYAPLQDGSLIPIDEAFHFIMLDQPDLFSDALRRSLQ